MRARNSHRRLSGIIALVAVIALLAPPAVRASSVAADGQHEGIKVYGDWTIEIRDPDGTLVTRREFKNSLVSGPTGGRGLLAQLLKGSIAVKEWRVNIDGSPAPCTDLVPSFCAIVPPTSTDGGPHLTKTLVVTLTGSGEGLELSGNVTVDRASSINIVQTSVFLTPAQIRFFTIKNLFTTPIPVAAGQIVQVKVVFTFSSGAGA